MYAEWSRALVGMQPIFTHTPPSLSCSTTAVLRPSCALRIAQMYPPGPPPTMITSKLATVAPSLRISDCRLRIITAGFAPNPQSAIGNPQLQQHRQRILQHLLERFQKRRPRRAIDDAVIA